MTFTKKHSPGCGCCECEGTPFALYYRIPDGETEYFRTSRSSYFGTGFNDFESYNSAWDEVNGSWEKRYYQTSNDISNSDPPLAHGLMTEDDDALLVYKRLDQNQQRSVVTVWLPWINDEFPDYSNESIKSDCEIKVVCAYQDSSNYLFAKIRFKRRSGLPTFDGSYSEDLRRGADKVSEIEFYERSAGTNTKIGDTRYFYQNEGPWGGGLPGKEFEGASPIVIEWCYVPEAYENDGKMTVTIYSNSYNGFNREYYNSKGNLFDFKDNYENWWGRPRRTDQQGHWIFSEEMNASGTMVGFGTGTITTKPTDDELETSTKRPSGSYRSYNKGVVFEKFGNYKHNEESGACPECAQGCNPHITNLLRTIDVNSALARTIDAEFVYSGQYETIPSSNDDLNFTNRHLDLSGNEYAEIKANNSNTKFISYSEVSKAVDHTFKLLFFTKGENESTHEISLVFDYVDEDNYHRLHFSGIMSDPAAGADSYIDYQTAATLQLYKMSSGTESTIGDAVTATLNHQYIDLGVCTLNNQVVIWLGEIDAFPPFDRWGDSNGVVENEIRNTTLHGGVRQGFMTHDTSDDDVIQAPITAAYERRPYCYPCAKTRCEGCGNMPTFYKLEISWGRWGWSGDDWWNLNRVWITKPLFGDDPFNCRDLDGTYIATQTADCIYELQNDKFKFWLKMVRGTQVSNLQADVQMWINEDGDYLSFVQQPAIEATLPGNAYGSTNDCGMPHEFTVYSSARGWGFEKIKCHYFSHIDFQTWHYRVRIIRE